MDANHAAFGEFAVKEIPTIFIVDDDLDMCKSLKWLLESLKLKVEIYHSGAEYLEAYDPRRRGCLLIDMRMPGMSGLQLLEQLNLRRNPIPVIIISGHGDIPLAVRAMKTGAVDFISKPFNEQLLLERVQELVEKDMHRHPYVDQSPLYIKYLESLTRREREIMGHVVRGKLNKQIADTLGISMKTVEQHRANVMEKMHVASLAELIKVYYFFEDTQKRF
jgi:two-component system response regulator FixJ